jgi:perosamine synthetase
MDRILKIAQKHNLFIIEDCAEAIGSEYKGKKVGSFGDIACFSFFGNKTITCGEGGMVLTNNEYLHERILKIKGQGLAKYREYWHDTLGFNYRMTNIQGAIGLAQFEQVEKFINKKRQIAFWYKKNLSDLPVEFHNEVGDVKHTYWMNSILVKDTDTRGNLRKFLKDEGIETRPTFYPLHTMPIYSHKYEKHPVAEDIALRGINLPSYPELNENDIEFICNKIKNYFNNKRI